MRFMISDAPLSPERFKKDIPITESEPICPYCKKILNQRPKRKMKCPSCGNDIYVRSKPRVFSTTLLTKDESMAVDWFNKLEYQGIEQWDFINKREELTKKFGKSSNSTDIIWGLFNQLVLKANDPASLKLIYYEMALFLYQEGRDFFDVLQDSAKMRLVEYKQSGIIKKVKVTTVSDSCAECQKLKNQIFTIDEALEKMPIPIRNCTHQIKDGQPGWCRCIYVAEFDFDN